MEKQNIGSSLDDLLREDGTLEDATALALYREGRLSSGLAAKWIGEPRVSFLLRASAAGIPLLDDSLADFERERALL